jgi:hypothetical protein
LGRSSVGGSVAEWQGGRECWGKGRREQVGVGAETRSGAREEPQRRRDVAFDGGR